MPQSYGPSSFFGNYSGNLPTITYKGITYSGGVAGVEGSGVSRQLQAVDVKFTQVNDGLERLNAGNGDPSGFNRKRFRWEIEMTLKARATSAANRAIALLPCAQMQVVTLDLFLNDEAWINGDWACLEGGDISTSDDGEAQLTIKLERNFKGDGTEVTASTLLTVPS